MKSAELVCPYCGEKAEWALSYWSIATCTNGACGFDTGVMTDGMTDAQALEVLVQKWEVITKRASIITNAVEIKETVTGGFFVIFRECEVGFHLNRPSAESNRTRFIKALAMFAGQYEACLQSTPQQEEHDQQTNV